MLAERAAHLDALAPMLVGAHFVQRRLTPPAYADGAFPLNTAFDLNESLKACGFRLDELEQQCSSATCCRCPRRSGPNATCRCPVCKRVDMMNTRYRSQPVFGVVENKILIKSVLQAMRLPFVEPIFAALADGPAGKWPRFDRTSLVAAVRTHGLRGTVFKVSSTRRIARPHQPFALLDPLLPLCFLPSHLTFLILIVALVFLPFLFTSFQPATDGMGRHVEVFGREQAPRHDVAMLQQQGQAIAERAEAAISLGGARSPRWGQQYSHRGVLLEPRYGAAASDAENGGRSRTPQHIEYKAVVVFGVPMCVRAVRYHGHGGGMALSTSQRDTVELHRPELAPPGAPFELAAASVTRHHCIASDLTATATSHTNASSPSVVWCDAARRILATMNAARHRLDRIALRVALFFGADWYRLDLLTGHEGQGWRINEVTYPSAFPFPVVNMKNNPCDCAWRRLVDRYRLSKNSAAHKRGGVSLVPAQAVLEQIAEAINVSVSWLVDKPSTVVLTATHGTRRETESLKGRRGSELTRKEGRRA